MFNTIFSRKSIREYTGEKISSEDLEKILEAGQAAAVGRGDYESLLLTVISNQDLIDEIEANDSKIMGEESHPFFGAPQIVLISVKPSDTEPSNVEFASVGCIAENISLAATELGVGSCLIWGAIRRALGNEELLKKFELPKGYFPCGAVTLGKTNVKFEAKKNRHQIKIKYID
ncbi:MAG: nitroreductase family protein [Clostridiaceae bacterium]|nr:nitroreductase family protein [Clostridiaceae bacterium]